MLGKLTENVLRLKETDEYSFKAFFKWVTASIKTSSVSVTDAGIDDSGNVEFNNPGAGDAGDAGVKGSSSIWDNEW